MFASYMMFVLHLIIFIIGVYMVMPRKDVSEGYSVIGSFLTGYGFLTSFFLLYYISTSNK